MRTPLLPIRILFDNGKTMLELKPSKRETLKVNTFGDSVFKMKDCEVVNDTLQCARNAEINPLLH